MRAAALAGAGTARLKVRAKVAAEKIGNDWFMGLFQERVGKSPVGLGANIRRDGGTTA